MKVTAYTLTIVAVLIALQGCATLRGMGEDLQNLGRGMKQTIDEQSDGRS